MVPSIQDQKTSSYQTSILYVMPFHFNSFQLVNSFHNFSSSDLLREFPFSFSDENWDEKAKKIIQPLIYNLPLNSFFIHFLYVQHPLFHSVFQFFRFEWERTKISFNFFSFPFPKGCCWCPPLQPHSVLPIQLPFAVGQNSEKTKKGK